MQPSGRCSPVIVSRAEPQDDVRLLNRLDFRHDLDESWLQVLLDAAPSVIPVADIDERVEPPLFSLGREVETASGCIDNLFLSQSGHVVVVETKLWRNPEARRTVVAQILDYATHLRGWDYGKIQELWGSRRPAAGPLWEEVGREWDEKEWIDRVSTNLEKGRMTLLIVGDGIQSHARQLAEALDGHPNFPFRLGLLELKLYEMADGRVLIVPDVLAKTQEIERAVVRVTYQGETRPRVDVTMPDSGRPPVGPLSEEAFLEELGENSEGGPLAVEVAQKLLRALEGTDLQVQWKSKAYTIHAPDPANPGVLLSLGVVRQDGNVYAYLPWIEDQIARGWGSTDAAARFSTALRKVLVGFGGHETPSGKQVNLPLPSLKGREQEFVEGLVGLQQDIIQASASGEAVEPG